MSDTAAQEPTEFAVTAIGVDQPGIVAAVAAALVDLGGNVEDSAMTILGGQFAVVLIVAAPVDRDTLETALQEATSALELTITVSRVAPGTPAPLPTHVLSVYGADKPGILATVTRALADAGANVTDLETRLLSPDATPVYAMIIELVAGEGDLAAALAEACDSIGVDHTLRPLDTEVL